MSKLHHFDLAMRDPVRAALVGALPDSDFGAEYPYSPHGSDVVSATAVVPMPHPDLHPNHPANQQHNYGSYGGRHPSAQHSGGGAHPFGSRAALLDPNAGSDVRVGRYMFSLNQTITIGTLSSINMTAQPDTTIRPQRVTMNAPAPGFVTIAEIKIANVSVTIGGVSDAYDFNALGQDQALDMPTLTPANRASVLGNYTGFVPAGYVGASSYLFIASFKGPAHISAE